MNDYTGKWIAFNDPCFTDREPYCNRVSLMKSEDAIAHWRRTHPDTDCADREALGSFMAVHWAWHVDQPAWMTS